MSQVNDQFCNRVFDAFYDYNNQIGIFLVTHSDEGIHIWVSPGHDIIVRYSEFKNFNEFLSKTKPIINAYILIGNIGGYRDGKSTIYLEQLESQ